jgi:hypothetical protein
MKVRHSESLHAYFGVICKHFLILATGLEGLESFELIRESLESFGRCWSRGFKAA